MKKLAAVLKLHSCISSATTWIESTKKIYYLNFKYLVSNKNFSDFSGRSRFLSTISGDTSGSGLTFPQYIDILSLFHRMEGTILFTIGVTLPKFSGRKNFLIQYYMVSISELNILHKIYFFLFLKVVSKFQSIYKYIVENLLK